jgi:hypothetical protein
MACSNPSTSLPSSAESTATGPSYPLDRPTKHESSSRLEDIPAAGIEPKAASTFRTFTAILDFLYVFLMGAQKKVNGRFPSARFGNSLRKIIFMHICFGISIIYTGCYLHLNNVVNTVSQADDQDMYRRALYYLLGAAAVCHSISVLAVLPKVMGEKRITIPLYLGAGLINFANAINLLCNPNLANAFLLWGSVNTFIYVRAIIVFLSFAHIDFELLYTYGITAAGAVSYPLSNQSTYVYLVGLLPLLYAPFHEQFVIWFAEYGFTEEDEIGGNTPAQKHITLYQAKLRSMAIDAQYMDKLKANPKAQAAASKLQSIHRSMSMRRSQTSMSFFQSPQPTRTSMLRSSISSMRSTRAGMASSLKQSIRSL